jgi:hypothetical protein
VKGITNAGIVEGFSVVNDKLTAGICTVDCLRTNGQQLRIVFESDEEIDLSTLANGTKIFVEVDQSKIDDGSQNEENGSGIAEIKFDTAYPTKNFLALAEIVNNIPLQVGKMVEIKDSALENSPIIKDIETQVREVENIINIFETD